MAADDICSAILNSAAFHGVRIPKPCMKMFSRVRHDMSFFIERNVGDPRKFLIGLDWKGPLLPDGIQRKGLNDAA